MQTAVRFPAALTLTGRPSVLLHTAESETMHLAPGARLAAGGGGPVTRAETAVLCGRSGLLLTKISPLYSGQILCEFTTCSNTSVAEAMTCELTGVDR